MIFSSNNAGTRNPRVKFAANGNVGIGTTTPLAKLDIQGTQGQLFSVTDDLSGSIFAVSDISGVPIFDVNSSGVSYFDGNVGINVTNPGFQSVDSLGQIGIEIKGSKESNTAPCLRLHETGSSKGSFELRSNRSAATSGNYFAIAEGTDTFFTIRGDDDSGGLTTRGNVGIGTTSPDTKLHVAGNIRATGQTLYLSTSSTLNKIALNGTDMEIWSGALFPSIDITSAGLLKFGAYALSGAGTPTKLLGVDNSGNVLTTVSGGDLPGGPYLPLSGGTMTGNIHYSGTNKATFGTAATPELKIYNNNGGYNFLESSVKFDFNVLELDINGINGTTPIADLGPTDCRFAYSGAYKLYTTTTGITVANTIDFGGGNNDGIIEVSGSGDLIFKYKSSNPALTLDGGAVKTIVHNRLDALDIVSINNPSNNDSILNIQTASGAIGSIGFETGAEVTGIISSNTDVMDFRIGDGVGISSHRSVRLALDYLEVFNSSDNSKVRLNANGDSYLNGGEVGINETSPSATLHLQALASTGVPFKLVGDPATSTVQQLIRTTQNYTSSTAWYNIVCEAANASNTIVSTFIVERDGDVRNINNSYGQISDSRLKENIQDATPKLDDIMKVKVKNFNFIGDELKQIGVVAQELEEVFPGLVKEDEQPGPDGTKGGVYKSVKYSVLVPILVKAMQEQQEIIEDLKTRLTQLENNN